MNSLDQDPRWQKFNDSTYECPCCGLSFNGIFDVAFDHPDCWPHGNRAEKKLDILTVGQDRLSPDLCNFEEFTFIRCTLPIPIQGSDEFFSYGCWGSVHQDNFKSYLEHEMAKTSDQFEGCFSWLSNDLPTWETNESVGCDLVPSMPTHRPNLFAQDGPLCEAQENGISFDRLLDIYAAHGTDLRPHLS